MLLTYLGKISQKNHLTRALALTSDLLEKDLQEGENLGTVETSLSKRAKYSFKDLCCIVIIASVGLLFLLPQKFIVPLLLISFGILIIFYEKSKKTTKSPSNIDIEYHLPLMLERIIMGVQAGLDLFPAIKNAVAIGLETDQNTDPVTKIFDDIVQKVEVGQNLEEALATVAHESKVTVLKHTISHLVIAYRDGGELSLPLRELADATQNMYQEKVDEEIAKLPIRATLPLLVTFAGVLCCYLATPIVQVITMSKGSLPQNNVGQR